MTLHDFKKLNEFKGFYFFSPDTMRFFRSKIIESSWDSKSGYFVTSEQFDSNSPRLYTVRQANFETGNVTTISHFQQYKTLAAAKGGIRKALRTLIKAPNSLAIESDGKGDTSGLPRTNQRSLDESRLYYRSTELMGIRDKVVNRTKNTVSHNRYKTTSFTLLKEDYRKFLDTCILAERTPSAVLRELIKLFIESENT